LIHIKRKILGQRRRSICAADAIDRRKEARSRHGARPLNHCTTVIAATHAHGPVKKNKGRRSAIYRKVEFSASDAHGRFWRFNFVVFHGAVSGNESKAAGHCIYRKTARDVACGHQDVRDFQRRTLSDNYISAIIKSKLDCAVFTRCDNCAV
jgi:hypothetical protein